MAAGLEFAAGGTHKRMKAVLLSRLARLENTEPRMVKIFKAPETVEFAMIRVRMKRDKWARLLADVTAMVNQQLLLQTKYLAAENRILRAHLPTR